VILCETYRDFLYGPKRFHIFIKKKNKKINPFDKSKDMAMPFFVKLMYNFKIHGVNKKENNR